ncbi:MAG: PEGA domain-containing protein [Spirochaetia bacterium]|nr:PEGA domain-containing protein [Spirochaetia bacterium]
MFRWILIAILLSFAFNLAAEPKSDSPQIRIVTRPAGAAVFINGVEKGKTPLEIPAGERALNVRIFLQGYQEIRFPIQSTGDLEMILSLQEDRITQAASSSDAPGIRPDASKNRAPYWGAFARSLILPGWGQHSKGDSASFWFLSGTLLSGIAYLDATQSFRRARQDAIFKYREGDLYSLAQAASSTAPKNGALPLAAVSVLAALHFDSGEAKQYTRNCMALSPVSLANGTLQTCKANLRALHRKRATGYVFAGLYLWNVADALLATDKISLGFGLPTEDRGFVLATTLKF